MPFVQDPLPNNPHSVPTHPSKTFDHLGNPPHPFSLLCGRAGEQYILPPVHEFYGSNPLDDGFLVSLERLLTLVVPNTYFWLLGFYGFFHVMLNLLSEVRGRKGSKGISHLLHGEGDESFVGVIAVAIAVVIVAVIVCCHCYLKKRKIRTPPDLLSIPQSGGKMPKRLVGIIGFKYNLNGFPDGSNIGSTV